MPSILDGSISVDIVPPEPPSVSSLYPVMWHPPSCAGPVQPRVIEVAVPVILYGTPG